MVATDCVRSTPYTNAGISTEALVLTTKLTQMIPIIIKFTTLELTAIMRSQFTLQDVKRNLLLTTGKHGLLVAAVYMLLKITITAVDWSTSDPCPCSTSCLQISSSLNTTP